MDNARPNLKERDRGEEWDGANRASWRLTIKDQGSTDVMQLSSTYWISIRMNCGKLSMSRISVLENDLKGIA